jgi:hypothetical protein
MASFGIYLFKVSACLAVFYLLYSICFRNNTFFSLNRYYLLLGLVASFAIPLFKLPAFTSDYAVILNDPFKTHLIPCPIPFLQLKTRRAMSNQYLLCQFLWPSICWV